MIKRSVSLERRLTLELLRHAGSLAKIVFYHGEMPQSCERQARGERVASLDATEFLVRDLGQGKGPEMAKGADYWRLLDNGGNVVMQGDGHHE